MNKKISTVDILLTVIAIIAIIWYIFDGLAILNYWYSLPMFTVLTGIFSVWIIPVVSKRIKQINSIIATGLAIIGFHIFSNFVPKDKIWIAQLIIIAGLSIFIDIYSWATFHIADSIFNIVIAAITVWLLSQTDYWLLILLILMLNFCIILTVKFRFSIKKFEKDKIKANKKEANKSE